MFITRNKFKKAICEATTNGWELGKKYAATRIFEALKEGDDIMKLCRQIMNGEIVN